MGADLPLSSLFRLLTFTLACGVAVLPGCAPVHVLHSLRVPSLPCFFAVFSFVAHLTLPRFFFLFCFVLFCLFFFFKSQCYTVVTVCLASIDGARGVRAYAQIV